MPEGTEGTQSDGEGIRQKRTETRKLTIESTLLVLTFMTSVGGGIISYLTRQAQEEQQRQLSIQSQKLEELKETNTYTLSVHKEVVDALKSRDAHLEKVAIALVESMPDSNRAYRVRLLSAISAATENPEVRERAEFELDNQKQEQRTDRPAKATGAPGWKVDVFYCEQPEPGGAEPAVANQVARALRQAPLGGDGSIAEVRVRPLPVSVNRLPRYGAAGIQVRYDDGEMPAAREVARIVSRTLMRNVAGVQSYGDTHTYLSVFVCPEGPSPHSISWVESSRVAGR